MPLVAIKSGSMPGLYESAPPDQGNGLNRLYGLKRRLNVGKIGRRLVDGATVLVVDHLSHLSVCPPNPVGLRLPLDVTGCTLDGARVVLVLTEGKVVVVLLLVLLLVDFACSLFDTINGLTAAAPNAPPTAAGKIDATNEFGGDADAGVLFADSTGAFFSPSLFSCSCSLFAGFASAGTFLSSSTLELVVVVLVVVVVDEVGVSVVGVSAAAPFTPLSFFSSGS